MNSFNYICQNSVNLFQDGTVRYWPGAILRELPQHGCNHCNSQNVRRRCREENIRFIGPSPESIEMMGDKISARKKMIAAGVPVVPGTTEKVTNEAEAVKYIKEIGLPVMIKASAGGGGKGMRLVNKESQIASSLRAARSEAKTAFGDDAL